MKCISRPWFSFLSNDTSPPPLNLRMTKWKMTLWSNWAWPWSRQSCYLLFSDHASFLCQTGSSVSKKIQKLERCFSRLHLEVGRGSFAFFNHEKFHNNLSKRCKVCNLKELQFNRVGLMKHVRLFLWNNLFYFFSKLSYE